jgi:glyoxylase-like metal-dependent hydrolase (beta-lactamase superfamily II)
MRKSAVRALATSLLATGFITGVAWSQGPSPPPPSPQRLADGVWLIAGGFPADREPDGNTVVFEGRTGLVVMDTGRHSWHRRAILDFARTKGVPVAAIINSHWHLDHTSGNAELRRAYPRAAVYASRAVETMGAFVTASLASSRAALQDNSVPASLREDIEGDIAVMQDMGPLQPTSPVIRSMTVRVGGRRLEVNLAADAATAGDVWVYDPASRIVAAGDLITLPAAFLDTACPEGWRKALDAIWAKPFTMVVPGHGAPMSREGFRRYREAFGALIDCSRSNVPAGACASAWAMAVEPLMDPDPLEQRRAQSMTVYYVDYLRANGGRSRFCGAALSVRRAVCTAPGTPASDPGWNGSWRTAPCPSR